MDKFLRLFTRSGLLGLFLVGTVMVAYSQEKTITGTVTDAESGETLIGVNITALGDLTMGTVTDIDGNYSLTIPDTVSALRFSYVGYSSQIVEITDNVINVELQAGQELSEVVVVGYGTQKTREVTSAVSSVKAEDFNRGNISDPIQLIQGKVSGLSIARPGSDPNASFNIRLRGLSTFGSNTEPLIIIDGIQGASLQSVDPQDIVSMDVLKDASAAAIYGTKAASGVIIITTKKGQFVPGAKPFNVEFNASLTAESPARTPSVLTAEEYRSFSQATDYGDETDWFDELTRTGLSQTYNLAVNGADENTSYRVSANYRNVQGVMIGTGFRQLNGRLNLTQKALKDKLVIDMNLAANLRNEDYAPSEALRYAVRFNPTAPIREDTTDFSQEWGGYFQRNAFYFYNPMAIVEQNTLDGRKNNMQSGVKGTYEIIPGLKVAAFYSMTSGTELYGNYWSKVSFWNPYDAGSHKGYARKENKNNFNQLFELTGTYERTLGKYNFSLLGGYSWQEDIYDDFWAYAEGFLSDDFGYNSLGSASGSVANDEAMSSYKSKKTLVGFFARGTFNYDNGVFLTVNFRRDGSSMFGKNQKWGNFPGLSAGVDIARFVEIPEVNRLKVRGGYGITGNLPPDPYLSLLRYDITGENFFYNGGYIQAYGPVINANPNLKWETKEDIGVGIDFALFDYSLTGSIDYFRSNSSDLIIEVDARQPPNPAPRINLNLGELENSGVEFALNYKLLNTEAFALSADLNFTRYFDTKLGKVTTDLVTSNEFFLGELGDPFLIGVRAIRVTEGEEIGQIIGPELMGVDTAGRFVFRDDNQNEIPDTLVLGNGLPDFQLGLGANISYKGFFLNFFFRGVFGHSLVNVNNAKFGNPNVLGIQSGVQQALEFKDVTEGSKYSSVHVEKADFVRLDNWSFGYNFSIPDNDYIQSLRLYLSGQNLFTITNYSGVDPEVRYVDSNDSDNPLAPGIDRQQTYFSTRSFTLGVSVVF